MKASSFTYHVTFFCIYWLNPLRPRADMGWPLWLSISPCLLLAFQFLHRSFQSFVLQVSRLQVFFGLTLFLWQWWFYSRAWRVIFVVSFLSVWSIHFHFLDVGVTLSCFFLFAINSYGCFFSGHLIPMMFHRHLLINACHSFGGSNCWSPCLWSIFLVWGVFK